MPVGTPIEYSTIKTVRAEAGLSQAELAKRAGISNGFIAMIELGQRHPSMRVVQAIARELDVPVSRLVLEPVAVS